MLFGNKNNFAIEYNLIEHPYGDERGLLRDSWGYLNLWLDGVDLLQLYEVTYDGEKKELNYQWNLNMIVEWLSENIHIIITPSEFPNNIQAISSIDYTQQNERLFPELDTEEFLGWHKDAHEWLISHWFISGADGSNLPNLFLRRVSESIEISWDNKGLYENRDIFFCSQEGCELVDMDVFYKVTKDFINDFIARFSDKYPKEMQELKNYISMN